MSDKIHYKTAETLFGFTRQTWSKWQTEERPIIKLLQYFNNSEIVEFLNTGKIQDLEKLKWIKKGYTITLTEAMKLMIDGYILESYTGFKFNFKHGAFCTTDDQVPFHAIDETCTNMMFKIVKGCDK